MKLTRLFALLLFTFMLAGCGNGIDSNNGEAPLANAFNGTVLPQNSAADSNTSFKIHDCVIDHPELINTVIFNSDILKTHVDSYNRLLVSANCDTNVTFDRRFTNLELIAITKLYQNHQSVYIDTVIIDIEVETPTLKAIDFSYETESKERYHKEGQITFGYNDNELETVHVTNKSGRKDWVRTFLHNFKIKDNGHGYVFVQGNVQIDQANICNYSLLDIGRPYEMSSAEAKSTSPLSVSLGRGFYDIDPRAGSMVYIADGVSITSGYYTQAFKDYCEKYCPHCHPIHYGWRETLRTDEFKWTIRPIVPVVIDGCPIFEPEKIETVQLTTARSTELPSLFDGTYLVLNVAKSMNVAFDERFSSLERISGLDVFTQGGTMTGDINVNITVSTPSFQVFQAILAINSSIKGKTMRLNFDFSNLPIRQIITQYEDPTANKMVYFSFNNFITSNFDNDGGYGNSLYMFCAGTQVNDCRIEQYDELSVTGSCKFNSGYFDIDDKANAENKINLKYLSIGRGGYYTSKFYNFLASDKYIGNVNTFLEDNFHWNTLSGNEGYDYEIVGDNGLFLIDGLALGPWDTNQILTVELTTKQHTHIDSNELYINIFRNLTLNFDAKYSSLINLNCRYVFDDMTTDIAHNININISVTTNSFKKIRFNYDTIPANVTVFHTEYPVVCLRRFHFNVNINNLVLQEAQVFQNLGGGNTVYANINNLVSSDGSVETKVTQPGLFYFGDNVKLFNSTILEYAVLNLEANAKIISGYYDYPNNSTIHLWANHCGVGGYYTDDFKEFAESKKSDTYDFVAEGLSFVPSYIEDFPWKIGNPGKPLSPSPEEIQDRLDDMTTMKEDILNSFIFSIAYEYGYPNKPNDFQIQVGFNYEEIYKYCSEVIEDWGKERFESKDKLTISFETGGKNIFKYDLINDQVLVEINGVQIVYDDNPSLPTLPNLSGYRIFTIDLGNLLENPVASINNSFNVKLSFSIEEPSRPLYTPLVHTFNSYVHNESSITPNSYSFSSILYKYLSHPVFKDNESLNRCKSDLGL